MRVTFLYSVVVVFACGGSVLAQSPPTGSAGISSGPAGRMPKIDSKPEPESSVSSDDATCTIVLRAIFDKKGKVTNIRFVEARPEPPNGCFDVDVKTIKKRSIDAAKKIKFIPAVKDGKPVSMWMQLEYNFSSDAAEKK